MANTTLKTRIQLKYDTYENWQASTFIPLAGEMCLVNVPAQAGAATTEPTILFKVGDGVKKFSELGWGSGLAADVYAWAKKTGIEFSETGTGKFISGIEWDAANDKIKVTKTAITTADITDLQTSLDAKVDKTQIVQSNPEGEPETWTDKIYSATATWNLVESAKSQLDGEIGALEGKITAEETRAKAAEEKNAGDITALTTRVTTAEGDIDDLEDRVDTLESTIEGLEGAMHFVGTSTVGPEDENFPQVTGHTGAYKSGDVVLYGLQEYIYDGTSWKLFGDEGSYAVKGSIKNADIAADAAIAPSKIAGLTQTLNELTNNKADKADLGDLAAKDTIKDADVAADANIAQSKIAELPQALAARVEVSVFEQTVNDINTELAKKAETDDLNAIAFDGDAKHLVQTAGDYLILNCGSATTIID